MRHTEFRKKYKYLTRELEHKSDIKIKLWLKNNKYRDLKPNGYTGIYYKDGIIIKREGIIVSAPKDIPAKYRAPTIIFVDDIGNNWRIQPRVCRKLSHKIVGVLKDYCPLWSDSHKDNCGHLDGAPVIFDW